MISATSAIAITYVSTIIGLIWALINYIQISRINLYTQASAPSTLLGDNNKIETMLAIGESIARVYTHY